MSDPHVGSWSQRQANAQIIRDQDYRCSIPGPYRVLRYYDEESPRSIVASGKEGTIFIAQENLNHNIDSATLQLLADAPTLKAENDSLREEITKLRDVIKELIEDRQSIQRILNGKYVKTLLRDTFNKEVVLGHNNPDQEMSQ